MHCDVTTRVATTVGSGAALLESHSPDLLLVDVRAGHGAGASLLESTQRPDGPAKIAFLRERGSALDAFKRGADQVVMVPFTPDELAVRTFAQLRRLGRPVPLEHDHLLGGLRLSLDERITVRGRTHTLTPLLNSLLYLLAANRNEQVALNEIRELVWGLDLQTSEATIRRRIAQLRTVLGRSASIAHARRSYVLEMSSHT